MISAKFLKKSAIVDDYFRRNSSALDRLMPPSKKGYWAELKFYNAFGKDNPEPLYRELSVKKSWQIKEKLGLSEACKSCAKKLNINKDKFIKEK